MNIEISVRTLASLNADSIKEAIEELAEDDDVVWSEESCLDIDIPTVEEIVKYPGEAKIIGRDGPKYGADEKECARVLALCNFLENVDDHAKYEAIEEVLAACVPTPATYKTASELKAAKDSKGKGIK